MFKVEGQVLFSFLKVHLFLIFKKHAFCVLDDRSLFYGNRLS